MCIVMKKNVFSPIKTNAMIAFVFDSGKISSSFYGDAVFESIIKGKEIVANSKKIVFSVGDIFDKSIYDDITPYIVRDELCTIPREQEKYEGILYAVLMEDIDEAIALNIDLRLKNEFKPYIGMTSIDIESSDARKQFWKNLIRRFSIELNTITCFGSKEEGYFAYQEHSHRLIEQMKRAQGITVQLKAENALEWVGRMNNIRNAVEEIINTDLIYI